MMRHIALACSLLLVSGVAAVQDDEDAIYPDDDAVPSERCISRGRIERTDIVDERSILFHMRGGGIYRNVLSRRCPGLSDRKPFSYDARSSRVCAMDRITVLERFGAGLSPGVSCSLGKFYPVSETEAEAIEVEAERAEELGDIER